MSFRRLPFQFSTTDPVDRQRELERRFGLPSSRNMFVDVPNPLSAGTLPRDSNTSSSSPRLQHRVPIFVEGYDQPVQSSVDSTGVVPENKKPNVRVIPIEVEGAEKIPSTMRHRTLSGPAGRAKEQNGGYFPEVNATPPLKHSMVDLSQPSITKSSTLPRVHNIPIQVEGDHNLKSPKVAKVAKPPRVNGCTVAKSKVKSPEKGHKKTPESHEVQTEVDRQKNAIESSLKKVENVLEELKSYEAGVKEFSGSTKDKQYRYLDEMLTRCMLKMDEIDTMGNENLRSARKSAIKKIQACIDLLENTANTVSKEVKTSEVSEMSKTSEAKLCETAAQNDVEMVEGQTVEEDTSKTSAQSSFERADVEMKSQNAEQESSKIVVGNALQKNDVGLSQNEVKEIGSDVSQNEVDLLKSDVEMSESQDLKPNETESEQISSEAVSTEEGVTNACEVAEKFSELSREVPEFEMAEVKRTVSSQDLNAEIPEVEMNDTTRVPNTGSDTSFPLEQEEVSEVTNLELASSVAPQEDIEMKDIQSTLDDMKESVAEDKSIKCISSQSEKETRSNGKTVSDVETSHNVYCDSDNVS